MAAMARALMAQPRLLLFDEPSLGLAPTIVLDMFAAIRGINRMGVAVPLVEQTVAVALEIAARTYVPEEGRIACEGTPRSPTSQQHIRCACLGEYGRGVLAPSQIRCDISAGTLFAPTSPRDRMMIIA